LEIKWWLLEEEEKLVEYILKGLDSDFSPVVSTLITRKETIIVSEDYQLLLAFETHMDILSLGQPGSSANLANHGGRGNGGGLSYNNGDRGGGHCDYNGGGHGNGDRGNFTNQRQGKNGGGGRKNFFNKNSSSSKSFCQVCFKGGHTADRCWHQFDKNYVPEEKHRLADMNSYNVDTNWYTDTGTTDHITEELEKLAVHDTYNGVD
jgi:hypothetical protein